MRLSILKGCCGGGGGSSRVGCGGGRKSARRSNSRGLLISNSCSSKTGNNVAITGSIVLLLIWSFVGVCRGKPFHAGGQAEIEEDTTQGSLKEKFPPAASLLVGSSSSGRPHSPLMDDSSLLEDDGDEENNEAGAIMVRNVAGLVPLGNQQRWGDYKTHRHMKNPSVVGKSNYAAMHKRSLGGGERSFPVDEDEDEDDGDGEEDIERLQRFTRGGEINNRPMYYEPSRSFPSAGSDAPAAASSGSPNIRQKLMHLRNQYGDKWFSFVGPYAYRKRQILYRQCFFNPISCF